MRKSTLNCRFDEIRRDERERDRHIDFADAASLAFRNFFRGGRRIFRKLFEPVPSAFGLAFTTPRLLLFFPIMGALAFAVMALFRKERAPGLAVITIVAALGLVALNQADLTAPTSSNLQAAEIADWNWQKDPTFGGRGTIKWNVVVRNKSDQNIRNAKVEFTTYDKNGKLVASTFAFVDAIPPGQSRSTNSFADFYGTEVTAKTQLGEVYFAN